MPLKWTIAATSLPKEVVAAFNEPILGFIRLTAAGDLEYIINDEVVAVLAPDDDPLIVGCF